MSDPSVNLSAGFAEFLSDDEDIDDQELEAEVEEEEEEEEEVEERALADFAEWPVYVERPVGQYDPLDGAGVLLVDDVTKVEPSQQEHSLITFGTDDDEPLTLIISTSAHIGASSSSDEESEQEKTELMSGRGTVRGRAGRAARASERGNEWVRGQPLRERYEHDQDIPEDIRFDIRQIQVRRQMEKERKMRRERNKDVNDDERDEIERFFEARQDFDWASMEGYSGQKETFIPERSGPTRQFNTAYDAFRAYWDESILDQIVRVTNEYAKTIQRDAFQRSWYPTNTHEIITLFAFWIMMGIIRMPTIKSCFTQLPILRTDVFRTLFIENRYWNLNAALHFERGSGETKDPIHPIRPVVDHLNTTFKELYDLEQNVAIDESLTLWKGPFKYKQSLKTKSAKLGIKTYQLCESSTGYLWNFFIYVGHSVHTTLPASHDTVITLIKPILNRGHVLFMDNYFNSPLLARFLKLNHTDCVGTLRVNRKHVPLALQRVPLKEGEYIARRSGDIVTFSLHDRRRVSGISTYHDMSQVRLAARTNRQAQYKLKMIDDYNHGMGGVDKMDQMLEAYLVERKQCSNWANKMFKRLLNISVQNSRILVEKCTNTKIDSLAYRLSLVSSLKEHHLPHVPTQVVSRIRVRALFSPSRLTGRHFIRRTPITAAMLAKVVHRTNRGRRRCAWCNRNPPPGRRGNVVTVYECPSCDVPLCLEPCFEQYHTIP